MVEERVWEKFGVINLFDVFREGCKLGRDRLALDVIGFCMIND